jgi:regulator of replication initiation timing
VFLITKKALLSELNRIKSHLEENKETISSLLTEEYNLSSELKKVRQENRDLKRENKGLKRRLDEVSKNVREQTEADILLNALKVIGVIRNPDGETKQDIMKRNEILMSMLQAMQTCTNVYAK